MLKTRVTEILGIKYPIVQGGMRWVSCAELAAAVSNAGGLGIIASTNFESSDELRREVLKTKELTDKPFGVNISLFPAIKKLPNDEFIDVIIEERVAAVETSGTKSPEEFITRLHAAGVKVIHKTATVRHACKGEQVGADAVAVVGIENGGNVGMEDVTTMVLVSKTAKIVQAPVISGGGVYDAGGFVAALALGAEGVLIGTRFMATRESPAHPKFKEWMLKSQENETVLAQRSIRNTHRTLINKAVEKTLELESRGATLSELLPWISGDNFRRVVIEGELDAGMAYCGQVVGLINDIPTVKEVIDDLISGALAIGERLSAMGVF